MQDEQQLKQRKFLSCPHRAVLLPRPLGGGWWGGQAFPTADVPGTHIRCEGNCLLSESPGHYISPRWNRELPEDRQDRCAGDPWYIMQVETFFFAVFKLFSSPSTVFQQIVNNTHAEF